MYRFENPEYLWLLLVVLLLAIIRFVTHFNQRKRLRKFGDPDLLRHLMPDVSRWRPLVKFLILELALTLLIVQDVTPNRLDRAKMMVENLVEDFTDSKVGLIVFAGDAFVQLPITSDYVSAKMFLSSIDPSMIVNQGTDIAAAINMASHSFTQQDNVGKAIIVITDGEDHEGGAMEAAKEAHDQGYNIYIMGIGSTKGEPVPDPSTGNYMTDNQGNMVMSKLNEDMCREIAQAGGGAYIHVDNSSSAQRLLDEELDKLEKGETVIYSNYEELFQYAGLLTMLLLIIEICIMDRKNPILKKIKLFKK